ncbi:hypothetical protein [Persephonella sp.]
MAKRDENKTAVGIAWDGLHIHPLLVDPVTGRLKIEIISNGTGSSVVHKTSKRDENRSPVYGGVDDNLEPMHLHVDSANGGLLVDLTVG